MSFRVIFAQTLDLIVAILFAALAAFAGYRCFKKISERLRRGPADGASVRDDESTFLRKDSTLDAREQRSASIRRRGSLRWYVSVAVLGVLVLYGLSRTATLCVFAFVKSLDGGSMETHFVTTVPATLFLALQTAFIVKWELQARDLTLLLRNHRFRLGTVVIATSLLLAVFALLVVLFALIDWKTRAIGWSNDTWNHLMTSTCGLAYMFNGAALLALGVLLRHLWKPQSDEARKSSLRALSIAVVFGVACVLRGGILMLFFFDSPEKQKKMHDVVHASAAPAGVLFVEFVCICFTLYQFLAASIERNRIEKQQQTGKPGFSVHLVEEDMSQTAFSDTHPSHVSVQKHNEDYGAVRGDDDLVHSAEDVGQTSFEPGTLPTTPPDADVNPSFLGSQTPGSMLLPPPLQASVSTVGLRPAPSPTLVAEYPPDALEDLEPLPVAARRQRRSWSTGSRGGFGMQPGSSSIPDGYSASPYYAHRTANIPRDLE